MYTTLFKLLVSRFQNNNKVAKFIGKTCKGRAKKKYRRWMRSYKTKLPYFYLKSRRVNKFISNFNIIKFYKFFWLNSSLFQVSSLVFIKRYAVFHKKSRMLKNILKRVLRGSKKSKKLLLFRKYKYSRFKKMYCLKKNFKQHTTSNLFSGVFNSFRKSKKDRKIQKLKTRKNMRAVFFRKFFFKTLIEGRNIIRLLLKAKQTRKGNFSNIISASAHTTFFNRLLSLELSIFNIVLRSRFTTSLRDAFLWVQRGAIYLNNKVTINPYCALTLGDRVQLIITNNYFLYKKVHFTKNKKDIAKLKSKLWLKNKGRFNLFRKRSKTWPKWILRTLYYHAVIPNFLEVDYFTLTSVVVYLPKTILEYDSVIWRYINVYNFRLYNWKIVN